MGFASLGSGSKGNATLVALAGRGVDDRSSNEADLIFMVDCGFNLRQTEARLKRLGLGGGDIDGIFVSH